jgi:hypothetical protein
MLSILPFASVKSAHTWPAEQKVKRDNFASSVDKLQCSPLALHHYSTAFLKETRRAENPSCCRGNTAVSELGKTMSWEQQWVQFWWAEDPPVGLHKQATQMMPIFFFFLWYWGLNSRPTP